MELRVPRIKLDLPTLESRAVSAPAIERVQNGSFASGAFWDTAGAGWAIAAGQATNAIVGARLTNTLVAATSPGQAFTLSITSVSNPAGTGWVGVLFNSSTLATQIVLLASLPNGIKTAMGAVTGVFDQLFIIATDDPGLVVDNVSFQS